MHRHRDGKATQLEGSCVPQPSYTLATWLRSIDELASIALDCWMICRHELFTPDHRFEFLCREFCNCHAIGTGQNTAPLLRLSKGARSTHELLKATFCYRSVTHKSFLQWAMCSANVSSALMPLTGTQLSFQEILHTPGSRRSMSFTKSTSIRSSM